MVSRENTGNLARINTLKHEESGVNGNGGNNSNNAPPLYFGNKEVSKQVFLRRRYVFAMVNERPVTKYHILICPVRQVRSMRELTELEYLELFTCASEIARKFQEDYNL